MKYNIGTYIKVNRFDIEYEIIDTIYCDVGFNEHYICVDKDGELKILFESGTNCFEFCIYNEF